MALSHRFAAGLVAAVAVTGFAAAGVATTLAAPAGDTAASYDPRVVLLADGSPTDGACGRAADAASTWNDAAVSYAKIGDFAAMTQAAEVASDVRAWMDSSGCAG